MNEQKKKKREEKEKKKKEEIHREIGEEYNFLNNKINNKNI